MYKEAKGQVWPYPGQEVWITRFGGMPPTRALATVATGDTAIAVPYKPDGTLDSDNKKTIRHSAGMQPMRAFPDKRSAVEAWNQDLRRIMQEAQEEFDARMEMLQARLLPEDTE